MLLSSSLSRWSFFELQKEFQKGTICLLFLGIDFFFFLTFGVFLVSLKDLVASPLSFFFFFFEFFYLSGANLIFFMFCVWVCGKVLCAVYVVGYFFLSSFLFWGILFSSCSCDLVSFFRWPFHLIYRYPLFSFCNNLCAF